MRTEAEIYFKRAEVELRQQEAKDLLGGPGLNFRERQTLEDNLLDLDVQLFLLNWILEGESNDSVAISFPDYPIVVGDSYYMGSRGVFYIEPGSSVGISSTP